MTTESDSTEAPTERVYAKPLSVWEMFTPGAIPSGAIPSGAIPSGAIPSFAFGPSKVQGHDCCGKPRGCNMRHDGCVYPQHPWKRAVLDNDTTVRCQGISVDPDTNQQRQCPLRHGHPEPC
jgi:hypothetical protein